MWYHQVVFGRVPLLGMGSGGAKSRFLQLRGYSTVGSAIRSQRIGCGGVRGRSPKLHRGDPFRGVGGISLSAARRQIAWGYSTVGSAIRSQRIGHEFESRYLHQNTERPVRSFFIQTAKTPQFRHCGVNSVCLEGTIINAAPRKGRKVGVWRAADLTRSRRSFEGHTV